MKKGTLNFLGRKNQSLFDTNRPIQEMENMDLVLDSSAIPETGTAKVRSRPTVKHHISSSDSVHGFAVPTPTVPLFPIFNGVKSDGSDGESNGSALSLCDPIEGDMFVPPPPSVAPPPPPTQFILPPPDFMGELDSPTTAMFQRPSMSPSKPPSQPPELEEDLALLKPPPMTPPKPPSTFPSASTPIYNTPPPSMIPQLPDCPKFAPPKPPSEKQQKSGKTPPPKPTRLSSISGIDNFILPTSPATTPQMSTPSSFNPQNTAKLYNSPKSSIISGHGDSDTRPKQVLLLQDSSPVPVQLNGKASPTPPSKPLHGTVPGTQLDKEPKVNLQANMTPKTPQLQPKSEVMSMLQEKNHVPSLPQALPKFSKEPLTPVLSEVDHAKFGSPSQKGKFSPLIDGKLRSLRPETSRDGSSTSPLALLQAAKEREKHRSSALLDNGPQSSGSIQQSNRSPNSFVVTPRSNSVSSTTSKNGLETPTVHSSGPAATPQTQTLHYSAPTSVRGPLAPTSPALSGTSAAATSSPSFSRLAAEKQSVKQATPSFDDTQSEANEPETPMALLPPPPEFANLNFGDGMDPPPDFPPPDPPAKKAPLPPANPIYSAGAPAPPPKPKPAAPPPKTPPAPVQDVKPQVTYQTLPRLPVPKPLPVSESQATLLSILQKKMLEMDHKISKKEMESSSDEWGSPLSDEETKIPFAPRTTPQNYKNYTLPAKPAKPAKSLDMRELETKMAKKQQENSSATSNGTQSKQQHGMTFTVRPGTKQPITLVSKGEPS